MQVIYFQLDGDLVVGKKSLPPGKNLRLISFPVLVAAPFSIFVRQFAGGNLDRD
jgi:hypothetical protein